MVLVLIGIVGALIILAASVAGLVISAETDGGKARGEGSRGGRLA